MTEASAVQSRRCSSCNKTFSKPEHLTRHLRSHKKERPYRCSICGKLYSRRFEFLPCSLTQQPDVISSDVLRRHQRSHQTASPRSPDQPEQDTTVFTPLSQEAPNPGPLMSDCSSTLCPLSNETVVSEELQSIGIQPGLRDGVHDMSLTADSSSWLFGTGLDMDVLDSTLSSAVSEWAQLPPQICASSSGNVCNSTTLMRSVAMSTETQELPADHVRQRWFTRLTVEAGPHNPQATATHHSGSFGQGNIAADEHYRAGLLRTLQPRMHDENLPSSDQLSLFVDLFFSRFNTLLPIVHSPSFKPTLENSLLFVSICSVGSLFAGSASAVAQGTRLFERLNKAILASWESILSQGRSNALSMVQAAVLGQTFAILSGRPKALVLADVLHGTVMAWARESNRNAQQFPLDPESLDPGGIDLVEQWSRWIDHEQRKRVEIALNIHDAELASLLHHEPLRKHRLSQYPRIASDALFTAPTASRWAEIYKKTSVHDFAFVIGDNALQSSVTQSQFSAYGVLESISAQVIEVRRSSTFDEYESRRFSSILMQWWRIYTDHFPWDTDDQFNLPILWHSIFISVYADVDLLEQASGRDGVNTSISSAPVIQAWVSSLDASRCLVHALLIQRHLERMRVSSEPAIHVPRALFTAALAWFCFTRVGGGRTIDGDAFEAPEIQLVGGSKSSRDVHGHSFGEATSANVSQLYRLVDLLGRLGRWGISESFSSILCAALESKQCV